MSRFRNITAGWRRRTSLLRARSVPAATMVLMIMVLAVGFLTDTAMAADDTSNEGRDKFLGLGTLEWAVIVLAFVLLIGFFYAEEELLLYGFFGLLIFEGILHFTGG